MKRKDILIVEAAIREALEQLSVKTEAELGPDSLSGASYGAAYVSLHIMRAMSRANPRFNTALFTKNIRLDGSITDIRMIVEFRRQRMKTAE